MREADPIATSLAGGAGPLEVDQADLGGSGSLTNALDEIFLTSNRSDAPGLVVGIAFKGRPIYRRGFGLASVQHGVANTAATRMRIASISKQFTSLACLLLVEDGRLDIDAPACRYLPELPTLRGVPTLRHFLSHTSGYRCTLELGSLGNGLALQPKDWQIRALARQTDVNFTPNHGQIYCNGTYHALSLVIERVTGAAYESFLKTRIFDPLGMLDTDSVPNDAAMVHGMASLHIPGKDNAWERAPSESELRGDGGIVSSIDDMLRWIAHLREPKIVGSKETWRQLLEPVTLANGFRSTYSLGLKRHDYRGVDVIHHSGGLFGLNAQMLTVPEHELDIIIMVNGAPLSASALSRQIVDIVIGSDRLYPARELAAAPDFQHLLGCRYRNKNGLLLGFEQVGQNLSLSLVNLAPASVLYDEGTLLRAGFEDIGVGPYEFKKADLVPAADGQAPDVLPMTITGESDLLVRLPRYAPDKSRIALTLIGRYRSEDLAADATITIENGFTLWMRGDYSASRSLTLEVFSATELGVVEKPPAVGRYALSVDLSGDKAIGFWIDTFHARRVHFDRVGDLHA